MFAGDIRVKAGQHKMAPLNMRAENERQVTKVGDGAIAMKAMK